MWFKLYKLRSKIVNETHLKFGKKYLYSFSKSEDSGWISILGFRINWTSKPTFSINHGYTKSIKIKKYYFTLK